MPAEPAVVVPVPPLVIPNRPVTSEDESNMAPMLSSPFTALTLPVPRELRVVEPVVATEKRLAPLVEAILKMGTAWLALEATTYRLAPAPGVVVLISKALAVLSQRKLAEPAEVVAAVK